MCDQGQGLCSGCNPWQASGERDGRDHCLWVSSYPELCSGRNRVYLDPRSSYGGFDLVRV